MANLQNQTIYNVEFRDGFSQLTQCFVTEMVDSDGLNWKQQDRVELVLGHNLDTNNANNFVYIHP